MIPYTENRLQITANRNVMLFAICFLFLSALFSCRKKEEVSTDPNQQLEFSEDSLFFDTVFTSQGSAWKYLWIYNRNSSTLVFDEIALANGTSSSFDLLINGQYRKSATDVRIMANDSMLLLVRANINPQNLSTPYLVRDSIIFKREGSLQDFDLWAYGQDAVYLTNHTCSCAETWYAGKPYVLTGTIAVPASCTLTVKPGAKVFFHSAATMNVHGALSAVGKADSLIVVHSDRLEDDQKKMAGSWNGIVFKDVSSDNVLEWIEVAGGENMIVLQTSSDADTVPELMIRNAKIFNASGGLINTGDADVYLYNALIHTSVDASIKLNGGTVYMDHLTVSNITGSLARNEVSIVMSGSGKYRLKNSIVWGNQSEEISYGGSDFIADYCLIKGSGITGTNLLFNQDPQFTASYNQDYTLKDGSPAIDAGITVSGQDRDLQYKLRDASPDMGAFEK